MTPDLKTLRSVAEGARALIEGGNINVLNRYMTALEPSAVLSLLDRVEALEERDDLAMQIISENAKLRREAEAMAETVRTLEAENAARKGREEGYQGIITALEAERDRLRGAGDALAEAAYLHMGTHPVFRMKPTGFEGSRARLQQTDQIETENALMTAVKEWKSNDRL